MSQEISIREASVEDRMALWFWYQEPLHRIVFPASSQESRDAHKEWWQRMESDPGISFWIGLIDIIRIGCVRFEQRDGGTVQIYAFLKPAYHRQGLLAPFLEAAMAAYSAGNDVAEFRLDVVSENRHPEKVLPPGAQTERFEDRDLTVFCWNAGDPRENGKG